jgi:hypothetical protein
MRNVKLERDGQAWVALASDGTRISGSELDNVAGQALGLAKDRGCTVELGEDVPGDALERGARVRALMAKVLSPGEGT